MARPRRRCDGGLVRVSPGGQPVPWRRLRRGVGPRGGDAQADDRAGRGRVDRALLSRVHGHRRGEGPEQGRCHLRLRAAQQPVLGPVRRVARNGEGHPLYHRREIPAQEGPRLAGEYSARVQEHKRERERERNVQGADIDRDSSVQVRGSRAGGEAAGPEARREGQGDCEGRSGGWHRHQVPRGLCGRGQVPDSGGGPGWRESQARSRKGQGNPG